MNKNFKKTLALLISVMAVAGTTFSAFADTVDTTNQAKQERKMPEKPVDGQVKQDGTTREKPNMDEMFTLTGETKTINIASADLGKNMPQLDKNATKESREEAMKNATAKTYQDYKVGDYISVEATDNTYATVKRVSNAMGGGGMRGFKGNGEKKENQNNAN